MIPEKVISKTAKRYWLGIDFMGVSCRVIFLASEV